MKLSKWFALVIAAQLLSSSSAFAETTKAYQVTGPVLEVDANKIVVLKGSERWEVARDANTKMKNEPKVGDKVTIHYRMTATSVESGGKTKSAK